MIKVLVVHQGRRDNYLLVKTLANLGYSVTLLTDFAYLEGSLFQRFLGNRRLVRASVEIINVYYLVPLILLKNIRRGMTYNGISLVFGKKAGKLQQRRNFHIVYFYANSGLAFFDERGVKVILYQMHPHILGLKDHYDGLPVLNRNLLREQEDEYIYSKSYRESLSYEYRKATRIITTCSFNDSMLPKDVNSSIIPYPFSSRDSFICKSLKEPLNLLYVGQYSERKGVSYLHRLVSLRKDINLTIITRDFTQFKNHFRTLKSVKVINGKVVDPWEETSSFDYLILPSYAEGFGLTVIEALQNNLPVLSSNYTVARDLIINGKNGFIINVKSSSMLDIITDEERGYHNLELFNIDYEKKMKILVDEVFVDY